MTPTPPPSLPAALPEPSGLYLRLWRAGFRWLYVLDAVGILAVTVLVTVVRFGTDWPEPGELLVGMVALTAILQLVFYFGGLYEKQARLGHRMWFARVVGLTLVGLAVGLVVVLPTGRYAVPRANLAAVGMGGDHYPCHVATAAVEALRTTAGAACRVVGADGPGCLAPLRDRPDG